jgi:hypothetical protein
MDPPSRGQTPAKADKAVYRNSTANVMYPMEISGRTVPPSLPSEGCCERWGSASLNVITRPDAKL